MSNSLSTSAHAFPKVLNVSWNMMVQCMVSLRRWPVELWCGPTWSGHFEDKKITDVFFYVPIIPASTRIHGASLCQRRCLGDLFWRCFPVGWMFCRAGLKLFRTSLRGLQCHIGPSSMLSRHYTGAKSGKITDIIVIFHEFWLVPYPFSTGNTVHARCSSVLLELR